MDYQCNQRSDTKSFKSEGTALTMPSNFKVQRLLLLQTSDLICICSTRGRNSLHTSEWWSGRKPQNICKASRVVGVRWKFFSHTFTLLCPLFYRCPRHSMVKSGDCNHTDCFDRRKTDVSHVGCRNIHWPDVRTLNCKTKIHLKLFSQKRVDSNIINRHGNHFILGLI